MGLEVERTRTEMSLRQWRRLFRLRTIWGMMLGFGGVNYTTWLYLSWLPGYLQAERHLTIARTGWVAVIPYLCGTIGSLVSGGAANRLIRRGTAPIRACKILIIGGMFCSALSTLGVAFAPTATGAVGLRQPGNFLHLLCRQLRLGAGPGFVAGPHGRLGQRHTKLRQLCLRLAGAADHRVSARLHPFLPYCVDDLLSGHHTWGSLVLVHRQGSDRR